MRPGDHIGPFVIERALGSGAMGTVFKARHAQASLDVAIKVVAPGLMGNPRSMERFKRESAILKQLKHPNIVRLVAIGKFQGTPFYAMEHIEGESLDRKLEAWGRISWERVVALGQQLCAALEHVHHRGIIHRDLKPSNVMVLADDTVKLTDFGIAKDLDGSTLTATNCTVGTAAYMSPEQCRGDREITPKSDLYSLGVMFFELLTGKKPFVSESPMELFMKHLKEKPPRPSRMVLDMPVWLDTLVVQLLEKDPAQRPLSAAMVGQSLGEVRQKAQAQQSAGMDVARSRVIDRKPGERHLEAEDKEAARTLLGKKKRKKRARPFYQAAWFRGAWAATVLAGIVWILYTVFLKTPAPETLYQQASELMGKGAFEDARSGPIAAFLRYYPDREDAHAQKMRRWADIVDLETAERQMLNRRRSPFPPVGAEINARKALDFEDRGDLDGAEKEWQAVLPLKEEKNNDERSWGLVAAEYLKAIQGARDLHKKVQDRVRTEHLVPEQKNKFKDRKEELAVQAERAAREGQTVQARKQWQALLEEARKEKSDRPWELLAAWRLFDLERAAIQEKEGSPSQKAQPEGG
jgi:serine/threonine-protein kinase